MILERPRTFQHYVMNLPASGVTFLDAFRGLYANRAQHFEPQTNARLPMIHVYCFSEHRQTEKEEFDAVCKLVSEHLGHFISPTGPDVKIRFVRKVSPRKMMFCASFRLPPAVAFAESGLQAAA